MKNTKKVIAILLAIVMIFSTVAVSASAVRTGTIGITALSLGLAGIVGGLFFSVQGVLGDVLSLVNRLVRDVLLIAPPLVVGAGSVIGTLAVVHAAGVGSHTLFGWDLAHTLGNIPLLGDLFKWEI